MSACVNNAQKEGGFEDSVVKEYLKTADMLAAYGKTYDIKHYNLDIVIFFG
jgi:hypothetical protein